MNLNINVLNKREADSMISSFGMAPHSPKNNLTNQEDTVNLSQENLDNIAQ